MFSKCSKVNKYRVPNPKPKRGEGNCSQVEKSNCAICGKRHVGKRLVRTDIFFGCGNSSHMVGECPMMKDQQRENNKA